MGWPRWMGPLLAVRPFKLHQSTRERATFVKWICESAFANTLERGGNLSLSSPFSNGTDFCLQYPGRGDVSNYLPPSLPSSSLLYVDFITRVRLSSAVRGGQCCFAGKVSKSRYTSSISVSENGMSFTPRRAELFTASSSKLHLERARMLHTQETRPR